MEKKAVYHILAIVVCILACVYSYSGDEMFSVGEFDFYFYLPIAVMEFAIIKDAKYHQTAFSPVI